MSTKKGGLGKGLDAIFAENTMESGDGAVTLKISELEPNREQPRKEFDDKAMAELADSIAQHGLLQPLLVRPVFGGGYQIVAGERRWRAARMAGLTELPAVIREMSDSEVMELALIENLQREDLTAIEEANGYRTLMEKYEMTQEEVAKTVGKSRPAVANALRLLSLPQKVLEMVEQGLLSAGHARALLSFPDEKTMLEAAEKAVSQGLSVRELERMAKKACQEPKQQAAKTERRITYFDEVELSLHEHLGRKVKVSGTKTKGTLQIEFYGEEDLQRLMASIEFKEADE